MQSFCKQTFDLVYGYIFQCFRQAPKEERTVTDLGIGVYCWCRSMVEQELAPKQGVFIIMTLLSWRMNGLTWCALELCNVRISQVLEY